MKEINNIKIGVLGGIGPESTIYFYSRLIRKLQENKLVSKNEDFPQIIINSIPAPELFGNESIKQDLKIYLKGIKELDSHNPDLIVIICNTAHIFYDFLQSKIKSPILNLPVLVENKLKKTNSYSILGSSTTLKKRLYNFENIKCNEIDKGDWVKLDKIIYNYNLGKNREQQKENARILARKYIQKGSEKLLLACTEISLILKDTDIPKIDTLDILVEVVIDYLRTVK